MAADFDLQARMALHEGREGGQRAVRRGVEPVVVGPEGYLAEFENTAGVQKMGDAFEFALLAMVAEVLDFNKVRFILHHYIITLRKKYRVSAFR